MHSLHRLSLSPRTILIGGAASGVLLGTLLAAITPTAMIYAPDPPWKASLPGQIGETAWVPTASAPEDTAPRFADAYTYTAAGWSFPPALRVEWQAPRYVPYPAPALAPAEAPAAMEPVPADHPAFEVVRTARQAADTAATAAERAEPEPAEAAEPAPSEDQLIPVEVDA